jgi:indolepyruvate ferredoxin oxidoreductase alpha subunit
LLPGNAIKRNITVTGQQADLEDRAVKSEYNKYIDAADHSMGVIATGIAYNYLMECYPDGCPYPVLKISQYPMPKELIRRMTADCDAVLIAEEGQPFVEDLVRGCSLYDVKGGYSGELHVEIQTLLTQDEFANLMDFLKENDIHGFITAGNVSEIYGDWNAKKKKKHK